MLAVASLTCTGAYAQTAPVVKAAKIRDFGRVSFEWAKEVRLKASSNGKQLRVTFEQPAKINSATILSGLKPYVTSVQQSADGRTLTLSTNQAYQIRSFVSNNVNGFDILRLSEAPTPVAVNDKKTPPPAPAAKVEAPVAAKPAVEKLPFAVVSKEEVAKNNRPKELIKPERPAKPKPKPTPKVAITTTPAELAASLSKLKPVEAAAIAAEAAKAELAAPPKVAPEPAAKPAAEAPKEQIEAPTQAVEEEKVTAETETENKAETANAPLPASEAPAETTPEAPATTTEETPAEDRPNPIEAINDAAIPAADAVAPAPAEPAAELPAVSVPGGAPVVTTTLDELNNEIKITFPFAQRVAVGAFRRGNQDYLYFSQPIEMNLEALRNTAGIEELKSTPLGNGLLVTFQTPKLGLVAHKPANGYAWNFTLTPSVTPPRTPIRAIPQTEPPLKPHLLLQVLEILDGVTLVDPLAGDTLVIVPSYRSGDGVFPARQFVEFDMPITAQGMLVKPKTDNLRIARLRDGMKITAPEGITLSKNLPAIIAVDNSNAVEGGNSLFPYNLWKTPEDKKSYEFANEITGQIPLSSGAAKQSLRLRLAQLYLAEERPVEALALLELIRREAPNFYKQNRLVALHGAANFLMNRTLEAAADFADQTLNNIPEVELWRDTTAILLTGDGRGNYMDYYKNFISHYPPYFAPRLALIASELHIGRKQYNRALKIYETLMPEQLRASSKGYMDYQMGRISAETGQVAQATKIWEELAKKPDNFIRSRAVFALTNHLLREAKIGIPEAIRRLDQIRITWRGDDFELGLLRYLGDLYEANHQEREALRAYREIIQFFPDNPENLALLGKMSDMFLALFNGGMADKMSPLEALALYYEFRDLTPLGDAGDKMVRNLADRLVNVDLLDRAAALLEHQVRYRLAGEQRSRVGAQLALIQLFNRQPKKALQALELTGYGQNPEALQHTRTILTARALADVGETPRALHLLEDDESAEAGNLRIGIHWDKKDWKNVISSGELVMGQRKDPTAKISDDESAVLLKLAIAYVFERQNEQVQYLRDYFLPLMKGNKNEHVFDFITRDAPVDYRNLAKLTRHLSDVETFLSSYRKKIDQEGLSKAIP